MNNASVILRVNNTAVARTNTNAWLAYFNDDQASADQIVVRINNAGSGDSINDDSGAKLTAVGVWTDAPSYRSYKNKVGELKNVLNKMKNMDIDVWQYKIFPAWGRGVQHLQQRPGHYGGPGNCGKSLIEI